MYKNYGATGLLMMSYPRLFETGAKSTWRLQFAPETYREDDFLCARMSMVFQKKIIFQAIKKSVSG